MSSEASQVNRRILVVDDNEAIHEDFAKILRRESENEALTAAEARIFGDMPHAVQGAKFEIDSAFQGEEGVAMVRRAMADRRPYAAAFIDVRMPPGWDGVETTARVWEMDPDIQTVICTAYSDYSWDNVVAKLGRSDRLLVLKKPFDNIEVLQLADALTHKWQRAHEANRHLAALQQMIRDRSDELNGDERRAMPAEAATALSDGADTQVRRQASLEEDLRRAIAAGEISVHYQPLVEIATRKVVGLEALARWQHPQRGWTLPCVFIPAAERSGLIAALEELVLRSVCRQVVRWERAGIAAVPVAVNISPVHLQRRNLVERVRTVLNETGMHPRQLALELTESALIENMQQHIEELQALRGDGVGIEIDDFGTGYSSLSYLKQLPVDTVKIDRSFIRQLDTNPVDAAIVSAIVAMAHSLRLRVVAEGVETVGQLQVLRRHGCDVAQGFFFSRPVPPHDCGTLLAAVARRQTFTDTLRLVPSVEPDIDEPGL